VNTNNDNMGPSVTCEGGRWVRITNDCLADFGLREGDCVCVLPAWEWPDRGPVLINENGREKVSFAERTEDRRAIRIRVGHGSWLVTPAAAPSPKLLGWIVRQVRYYAEPDPVPTLRLVS
jgi:hypothetical protein